MIRVFHYGGGELGPYDDIQLAKAAWANDGYVLVAEMPGVTRPSDAWRRTQAADWSTNPQTGVEVRNLGDQPHRPTRLGDVIEAAGVPKIVVSMGIEDLTEAAGL